MTSTEKVLNVPHSWEPVFTPEQKRIYRSDVAGFLADLGAVAERYGVVQIGRVLPGDEATYTAVYVARDLGTEYVTHLMYRIDDRPGGLEWAFSSGHYFHPRLEGDLEGARRAALADLAER